MLEMTWRAACPMWRWPAWRWSNGHGVFQLAFLGMCGPLNSSRGSGCRVAGLGDNGGLADAWELVRLFLQGIYTLILPAAYGQVRRNAFVGVRAGLDYSRCRAGATPT